MLLVSILATLTRYLELLFLPKIRIEKSQYTKNQMI